MVRCGPSRKVFVGKVTGAEISKERTQGTTGAVPAYVASRSDMVKVHDVARMKKVVDIESRGYLAAIVFRFHFFPSPSVFSCWYITYATHLAYLPTRSLTLLS